MNVEMFEIICSMICSCGFDEDYGVLCSCGFDEDSGVLFSFLCSDV